MSNPPRTPDATAHSLVETCRQIRKLLGSAKPNAALRTFAPAVAESLPLVETLLVGVEGLAERARLLDLQVVWLLEQVEILRNRGRV